MERGTAFARLAGIKRSTFEWWVQKRRGGGGIDGDLIIVGDAHQGLYQRRTWSWKSVGVRAQGKGRTITKQFDLHLNYRNSKEILEAAALFAKTEDFSDGLGALKIDLSLAVRTTGHKPVLIRRLKNAEEECHRAIDLVEDLVHGNWFGTKTDPIAPARIGILYPMIRENERGLLKGLVNNLSNHEAVWISEDRDTRKGTVAWRRDSNDSFVQGFAVCGGDSVVRPRHSKTVR